MSSTEGEGEGEADEEKKYETITPFEDSEIPSSHGILRSESSLAIISRRRGGSFDFIIPENLKKVEDIELISPGLRKLSTLINIRKRSTTTLIPSLIRPPDIQTKESIKNESKKFSYTEHQFDLQRLCDYFHTRINLLNPRDSAGLTSSQALTLLKQFGPNRLTPPERLPKWALFLMQFLNYFMLLLLLAGTISILSYLIPPHEITNIYLGVLLILVVIFTCLETFSVESQSDELMSKFRAMVPNEAAVIRDGILSSIPSEDLVVGDIVFIKSGDKIPADCRIIHVESLRVDQSLVTGEAEPIELQVEALENQPPLDAKNLIFNGTLAVEGSGIGVVIRTGDESMIGSIVVLTGETVKGSTTLKVDIERFVLLLTILSLIQAIVIFVVGILRGISPLEAFIQGFIGEYLGPNEFVMTDIFQLSLLPIFLKDCHQQSQLLFILSLNE
jgi:magnesium-transporting ATPase (P-type)